jgi:DNA-binding NtrC family response regulator
MNSNVSEQVLPAACDGEAVVGRRLSAPPGLLPASWDAAALPATWNEFKTLKRHIRDVAVQELERQFLIDALRRRGGNVSRAAAEIGIQRTNLHALMRKHGLTSRRKDLDRVA